MPRWLPTSAHLEVLETSFSMCRYPDPVMRSMLATQLGIKQRQAQRFCSSNFLLSFVASPHSGRKLQLDSSELRLDRLQSLLA